MMPSTSRSNGKEAKDLTRNWLELPSDIMASILKRIGVVDILENAQKVCTAWRKICKDPSMWRIINMSFLLDPYVNSTSLLQEMCKHAVDRSQGQLVHFTVTDICNDELLLYVAERSHHLRYLEISYGIGDMHEALKKFRFLEELNLYTTRISKEVIETSGRYCPMLKILRVNTNAPRRFFDDYDDDQVAVAIGENLPNLRHLELIGNNISNTGLQSILNGCRQLELLDLRDCKYLHLDEAIGKRCSQQIKVVKLCASIEDCPYLNKNYC